MEKMTPRKKEKRISPENHEKIDFDILETNSVLDTPIEKVKEIAPNIYKEIVNQDNIYDINEIYDTVYNDNENDFDSETLETEEIIEVNEENLEKLAEIAKRKKKESNTQKNLLEGFEPTAVDFIRRAKSKDEAIEVINYLEKRKELKEDKAKELREKLASEGLESFGSHKDNGYYFQVADEHRMKRGLKLTKRKE